MKKITLRDVQFFLIGALITLTIIFLLDFKFFGKDLMDGRIEYRQELKKGSDSVRLR